MTLALHALLRTAIDRECAGTSARTLRRGSLSLSDLYRSRDAGAARARLLDDDERRAYAAARMPATATVAATVLADAYAGTGSVPVASLLDLGTGPGTSLWAALEVWPALERAELVDRDAAMLALGQRLWSHHPAAGRIEVRWHQTDLAADGPPAGPPAADPAVGESFESHDLVVLSYVLAELEPRGADALVARAAALAHRLLVIVEPGTPRGFERVRAAIAVGLAQGLSLAAPCPHERACPLQGDDWCHFAARVARSRVHRLAKDAELGWEDEKYSYATLTRVPPGPRLARIIAPPQKDKASVHLRLCTAEGIGDRRVPRADPLYRAARHARWGDLWPPATHEPGR